MNSTLKKYQAWRTVRQRRALERWERIRTEGKERCVRRTALTYSLTLVGLYDVIDRVFYGKTQSFILITLKLIFFVFAGYYIGSSVWSTREAEYQNALREARVKALPPDNQA